MENESLGKIDVRKVVARDKDLNEIGLGLKKKSGPLGAKNHSKPNTLRPDTGSLLWSFVYWISTHRESKNSLDQAHGKPANRLKSVGKLLLEPQ